MNGVQTVRWRSLLLLVVSAHPTSALVPGPSQFVAAVYEHVFIGAPEREISRQRALWYMMQNLDVYETQMKAAKHQNASIIVFPEYGLVGFGPATRPQFAPFCEYIPDPTKISWTPCAEPNANKSSPVLFRLSCMARKYEMYVVADTGDVQPCSKVSDPECPDDGQYQYNAAIAFDPSGKLVARYHKAHPTDGEMLLVNAAKVPEHSFFDTPFGRVGLFICWDMMFREPGITLLEKYNVDHIAFPTAWDDLLPAMTALGFHSSWARGNGVNVLGANTHVITQENTGSGIYTPSGTQAYYRDQKDNKGKFLAALVEKTAIRNKDTPLFVQTSHKTKIAPNVEKQDTFYSEFFNDMYFFTPLTNNSAALNLCYNSTSDTCCSLKYTISKRTEGEFYALGVFDGLHTKGSKFKYYLQVCTVMKCTSEDRSTCGEQVFSAGTTFSSLTLHGQFDASHVYPQVLGDGVSLLPGDWSYGNSTLTATRPWYTGLLSVSLIGRLYEKDPNP